VQECIWPSIALTNAKKHAIRDRFMGASNWVHVQGMPLLTDGTVLIAGGQAPSWRPAMPEAVPGQ